MKKWLLSWMLSQRDYNVWVLPTRRHLTIIAKSEKHACEIVENLHGYPAKNLIAKKKYKDSPLQNLIRWLFCRRKGDRP